MPDQTEDEQTTGTHDATGASSNDAGTSSRGSAFPTVMVNAAEQDPNPAEATSDSTAPQKSSDYDNDREDLPPGPTSGG